MAIAAPTDSDYLFFRATGASALCSGPLRWFLFDSYYRAYYDAVQSDVNALAGLQIESDALNPILPRARAAIRTVAACSAWYVFSNAILRFGFTVALTGAFLAIVASTLSAHLGAFDSVEIAAAAIAVIAVFAYGSLWISRGLSFDVFWFLCWATLPWLAVHNQVAALPFLHLRGAPPAVIAGFKTASYGIATHAALILIATLVGRTIFSLTSNTKKRYPEEEIIETLIVALSYIEKRRSEQAQPQFREFIARQLDWIADRLEFDFFREYACDDALTASWSASVSTATASAVRSLKQKILLPSEARVTFVRNTLASMLLAAGRGLWYELPTMPDAAASASRKAGLIRSLQTAAAIALPAAAGVLIYAMVQEPFKTSASTALFGLAAVNLLAVLNPAGFDKQITAAKTVADALRKSS